MIFFTPSQAKFCLTWEIPSSFLVNIRWWKNILFRFFFISAPSPSFLRLRASSIAPKSPEPGVIQDKSVRKVEFNHAQTIIVSSENHRPGSKAINTCNLAIGISIFNAFPRVALSFNVINSTSLFEKKPFLVRFVRNIPKHSHHSFQHQKRGKVKFCIISKLRWHE